MRTCSTCKWWVDVKGPYSDGMWGKCDLSGMVDEKPKHDYKRFGFIAGGCFSGIKQDCYLHTHGHFGCKCWEAKRIK